MGREAFEHRMTSVRAVT